MLRDEQRIHRLHVLFQLLHIPLQLGSPVLEPRDHLGIAQAELRGDLVAVRRRQVLLVQEPLLQLKDLLVGKGRPAFPLLLRLLSVVEQVQVARLLCNNETSCRLVQYNNNNNDNNNNSTFCSNISFRRQSVRVFTTAAQLLCVCKATNQARKAERGPDTP